MATLATDGETRIAHALPPALFDDGPSDVTASVVEVPVVEVPVGGEILRPVGVETRW